MVARARHLSHRTEDVYHNFIKRYIIFHDKKHPVEMGAEDATVLRRIGSKTNTTFTRAGIARVIKTCEQRKFIHALKNKSFVKSPLDA